MPTITKDNTYTVILHFETHEGKQQEFLEQIGEQVKNTIQKFSGFISSSFLKGDDGKTIFNYAQWESQEAYENFLNANLEEARHIFETLVDKEENYHPLKVVRVFEK